MRLNLDKVTIWNGLEQKECSVVSIRKDFANGIYTKGTGLAAHALALKMWNGDGSEDYTDDEVALISKLSELCQPNVIDAVRVVIDEARRNCLTNK